MNCWHRKCNAEVGNIVQGDVMRQQRPGVPVPRSAAGQWLVPFGAGSVFRWFVCSFVQSPFAWLLHFLHSILFVLCFIHFLQPNIINQPANIIIIIIIMFDGNHHSNHCSNRRPVNLSGWHCKAMGYPPGESPLLEYLKERREKREAGKIGMHEVK